MRLNCAPCAREDNEGHAQKRSGKQQGRTTNDENAINEAQRPNDDNNARKDQ
jgi:hypothetical protein